MENEIIEEVQRPEEIVEETPKVTEPRLVQIDDKLHCRFVEYIPAIELNPNRQIYLNKEERMAIGVTKCFDLETMTIVDYDNTEDLEKQKLEELRAKREPLLVAFDKYKSNVNYGIEIETETDKINIITWYRLLLELNEYAFNNVPERVKYYL